MFLVASAALVQLDNREQPEGRGRKWGDYPHYEGDYPHDGRAEEYEGFKVFLADVRAWWPQGVPRATLVVLREYGATFYRELSWPGDPGPVPKQRARGE